jgi:3-oxoacyl-[acyl-carrier protein] reductase
MLDLQLSGKTALVTGASQGLGRAIVKTLAAEGVTVFATARNGELLASLTSEIEADGGTRPVVFEQDFVAQDGPQKIADAALAAFGHVDILVNNAGGSRPMEIDAPEEQWVEGMTLNFDRHRQLTQKLLPNFLDRRTDAIISLSGNLEPEVVNAAMVAKAGLVVWSKGLSEQLGQHGITVNCVQPGLIDTAQIRRLYPGEERAKFASREIALRDFGKPQDVANAVTFLASPRARYITGIVLLVDGGMRRYSF